MCAIFCKINYDFLILTLYEYTERYMLINYNKSMVSLSILKHFIATSIDTPLFNVKYLAIYKVQMHVSAISKLLYGCASVQGLNPLAKARGLSSCTDAQPIQ